MYPAHHGIIANNFFGSFPQIGLPDEGYIPTAKRKRYLGEASGETPERQELFQRTISGPGRIKRPARRSTLPGIVRIKQAL